MPNFNAAPPTLEDSDPINPTRPPYKIEAHAVDPDNPTWGLGGALLVWVASILLMFVMPLLFLVPYFALNGFSSIDPYGKTVVLLQVISIFPAHLLTLALVWVLVTRFGKKPFWAAVGWDWAPGFRLWSCIVLGTLLFIVGSLIAKLVGAEKPTLLEQVINSSFAARYLISFLAVFTAPVVEELMYRGVLYAPLQRLVGVPGAVITVLALFTVIHVPQYWPNIGVITAVGLLSIVLTFVRAYSGRLLPCIVIHLVFNGIQAVLLIVEPYSRRFLPAEPPVPPAFLHLPFLF